MSCIALYSVVAGVYFYWTLSTHPATPKKGKYDMMGFLTNTFQYFSLKLSDLNADFLFLRPHF